MTPVRMKGVVYVLMSCLFIRIQDAQAKYKRIQGPGRQAKYPYGGPKGKIKNTRICTASRFERTCYRDMPGSELNECLKSNFQQGLPRFKSGIPGIYNDSIDPLIWPRFSEYISSNFISGSVMLQNVKIWGLSALKILNVRADVKNPQKMLIEMDWSIPKMDLFGSFDLKGKIGALKFSGAGPFKINATGLYDTWKITGNRKEGDPYMRIVGVRGWQKVGTLKLWATGAAQNKRISDLVVATINQFWKPLLQVANPAIDREWSAFCTANLNKVFLTVPYDELFPLLKQRKGSSQSPAKRPNGHRFY